MISFENVMELEALLDPRLEIRKHSKLSLLVFTNLQVLFGQERGSVFDLFDILVQFSLATWNCLFLQIRSHNVCVFPN